MVFHPQESLRGFISLSFQIPFWDMTFNSRFSELRDVLVQQSLAYNSQSSTNAPLSTLERGPPEGAPSLINQKRLSDFLPGFFVRRQTSFKIVRTGRRIIHPFAQKRAAGEQIDREPFGFVLVGKSAPDVIIGTTVSKAF